MSTLLLTKKTYMKSNRLMSPIGVILLLVVITILNDSCTKPSLVGEDIFIDDVLGLSTTDTVSLFTTTAVGDSVRTYTQVTNQQLPNYLVGRLDDPIFGKSTAISYAQTRLLTTSPNFDLTTLDSVVLSLPYDNNSRHYGNTGGTQTIVISRLTEDMDVTATYYSNRLFQSGTVLGQKTFVPNFTDSVDVVIPESDTSFNVKLRPQLRVRLSETFGNELLNNSNNMTGIDDFLEYFKGIEIKGIGSNDALLSFDLVGANMTLFYTQQDSIFDADGNFESVEDIGKRFVFDINSFSAKSSYYFNDRTGVGSDRIDAPITQYLNNENDSLVFVQSMNGLNTKITFPYLDDLKGSIINKAELVVTVANRDDLDLFSLPEQLIVVSELDSNLIIIEDVAVSLGTSNDFTLHGGDFEAETIDGVVYTRYRLNISGHFQDMIDGIVGNTIYITTYPKPQIADRVVLGGGNHSVFPMKLNLNYTKID